MGSDQAKRLLLIGNVPVLQAVFGLGGSFWAPKTGVQGCRDTKGTLEVEERRREYGEKRIICYGTLAGRLVVVGYTPRGAVRHIFSMRKANVREKDRVGPLLGLRPEAGRRPSGCRR
nr:BrnT family toxin [Thioalkalivibrio sp.]